jgi:hypothetical protein
MHSNPMNKNSSKNTTENHRIRKMPGAKDLSRDWEGGFHYEYLSQIRLQATHKKHKSWMAKSSSKAPTLSSQLLSQTSPKMKEHSHLLAKELAKIQPLLLYIGLLEMTKVPLHFELQHKPSQGHFGQHMKFSIGRPRKLNSYSYTMSSNFMSYPKSYSQIEIQFSQVQYDNLSSKPWVYNCI